LKINNRLLPVLTLLFLLPNLLQAQDALPPVNQKVFEFCKNSMGKKIDRGECWDLAKCALNYAEAEWESPYNFGDVVRPDKKTILVGDIIQFENVKLSNGTTYPLHTAVVYEILGSGKYLIAHQNFSNVRKVNTRELDLRLLSKGSIVFYRPQ